MRAGQPVTSASLQSALGRAFGARRRSPHVTSTVRPHVCGRGAARRPSAQATGLTMAQTTRPRRWGTEDLVPARVGDAPLRCCRIPRTLPHASLPHRVVGSADRYSPQISSSALIFGGGWRRGAGGWRQSSAEAGNCLASVLASVVQAARPVRAPPQLQVFSLGGWGSASRLAPHRVPAR